MEMWKLGVKEIILMVKVCVIVGWFWMKYGIIPSAILVRFQTYKKKPLVGIIQEVTTECLSKQELISRPFALYKSISNINQGSFCFCQAQFQLASSVPVPPGQVYLSQF